MDAAPLTVAPLLLSLVLLISGGMKLAERESAADAFVSLRLPRVLSRLKAPQVLPYAEIVLAVALVVASGPAAVAVAFVALAVFVAYLVVIVRALGFHEPVTCSCFGTLGLGTVDAFTAVRNGVLVVLALLAVFDATRGRSVIERLADFDGTSWAWLAAVAASIVLTWLIVGQRSGMPTTSSVPNEYLRQPIPYGRLSTPDGGAVTLRQLARERAVLLLLVSTTCGSCRSVISTAREWQRQHAALRTVIVLAGEPGAATGLEDEQDFDILFDPHHDVGHLFDGGLPTAVLLGADGLLAGGPVVGGEAILAFLDDISAQLSSTDPS